MIKLFTNCPQDLAFDWEEGWIRAGVTIISQSHITSTVQLGGKPIHCLVSWPLVNTTRISTCSSKHIYIMIICHLNISK